MRVLIVNPPGPGGREYIREGRCEQRLSSFAYRMLPVSLPSTAGLLRREGHDVIIIDAMAPAKSRRSLWDEVRERDPQLVVVNVSTPTFESDLRWIAELRGRTEAHVTAIGVHVTATAEETLHRAELHSVVRGEPEWVVASLARTLASEAPLTEVLGLSFVTDGRVTHNPDRGFVDDLDDLPPPARDLLDERDYFLPIINRPYTLVVPSRGCPHHCTYCTAPLYYGKRLRRRSPSNVVDEIESVVKRGVVRDFVMWSDTFTLDKSFVLEVCADLERRRLGVSWMCNSRVDSIDRELARAMKSAGCTGISFGIESGVQRILDNVRKGTTVEQGRTAVKVTRDAGIETLGHFILGLPGETRATIDETIAYAKDVDPDWAQFYAATPLPGTRFYAQAKREGSLPVVTDWDRFELNVPMISTPALSVSELGRARLRAYAQFYLRPRKLRRIVARARAKELPTLASSALTFVRGWVLPGGQRAANVRSTHQM